MLFVFRKRSIEFICPFSGKLGVIAVLGKMLQGFISATRRTLESRDS